MCCKTGGPVNALIIGTSSGGGHRGSGCGKTPEQGSGEMVRNRSTVVTVATGIKYGINTPRGVVVASATGVTGGARVTKTVIVAMVLQVRGKPAEHCR